jgi:hypothetical protein
MIKFKLTPSHFEQLIKQSYSLDHIYLLKLVEANIDIQPMLDGSMKISGLYQSLVRKGLISDVNQTITQIGRELLTFVDSEVKSLLKKKKQNVADFDAWWNAFPSTDNFEHKGKKFFGSRGLKRAKDECRIKFNKILSEGDTTVEEMINATLLDVYLKKEASVKFGENRISYIQNSLTYLTQRSFEPFLEMIKTGVDPKKMHENTPTKRVTDI